MKILITTPLYPPDIAEPAPYVKEAARRLSKDHEVTVLTYGKLPEKVNDVTIITIPKSQSLPKRLFSYTQALRKEVRDADIIYSQNGPSVELPVSMVALFTRKPFILRIGDARARKRAEKNPVFWLIHRLAHAQANSILEDTPLPKPEILPLESYPERGMEAFEISWTKHLALLKDTFTT